MANPFRSHPKIRTFFILGLILLVTVLSYWPVFKADFVNWDDYQHLVNNTCVLSMDVEHIQRMFQETINDIYIPLTTVSFALEHQFFQFNPFFYHLDNILLHIFVTILVFLVGSRLGLSKLAAVAASLLFGIHPMRVESVAWVTERKDVLYAFFYMLALLSYVKYLEVNSDLFQIRNPKHEIPACRQAGETNSKSKNKAKHSGFKFRILNLFQISDLGFRVSKNRWRFLVLTTILGILSMLAKPMALSLPFILFLLDYFFKRRVDRWAVLEKIPLVLMIGGIAFITYIPHARIPIVDLLRSTTIWIWTFVFYLRQFLLPFFLLPVYQLPRPVTLANLEYSLSVLIFFILIGILWIYRRFGVSGIGRGWVNFALIFYVLSIFFLLRFDETVDINIVADRFMYLPSLGFCYLIGYGIERLWSVYKNRFFACLSLVMAGIVFFVLGYKTFQQCKIWRDSLSLWTHESKFSPQEPLALTHLADVLGNQPEYKMAEEIYKKFVRTRREGRELDLENKEIKENIRRFEYLESMYNDAIKVRPDYEQAYYQLGELYQDVGRLEDAMACYNKVITLKPKFKDAYFRLGEVFLELGNDLLARRSFEEIIKINPKVEAPYVNIILAYTKVLKNNPSDSLQQAREDVLERLEQLIENRSPKAISYSYLAYVYGEMGDWERAIWAYREVLAIHPKDREASLNLAHIYKDKGLFEDAVKIYQQVIHSHPKDAEAYFNLGVIYQKLGEPAKANEFFEKSLTMNVRNKESYFELGEIAERQGRREEAMYWYEQFIKADPENEEGYYALGNIHAALRENDKAVEYYLKTVQLKPDHAEALINLSLLSFMNKDFINAVEYYKKAKLFDCQVPAWYEKALEAYQTQ